MSQSKPTNHEKRQDTVLYARVPKKLLADLDRMVEREARRIDGNGKDPYPKLRASVSRSVLVRRALVALLESDRKERRS